MKPAHIIVSTWPLLFLAAACSKPVAQGDSSSPDQPAAFSMAIPERIELRVFADGAPLGGAVVQVRRHGSSELANSGVIAMMRSDAEGRAGSLAALVREEGPLEVIVIAPRFTGPYEPEEARGQVGLFAPAARLLVTPADLRDGLQIDLASKEKT